MWEVCMGGQLPHSSQLLGRMVQQGVFASGLSPFEAGFYCSLQNEVTGGGDGGHSMKFAENQTITAAEVCARYLVTNGI